MPGRATAHIETTSVVLRVFSEGREFGDPYDWCATGVRVAPGVLEILGVLRAPSPSQWRALFRVLRSQGWHTVVWWRHRPDGRHERHEMQLAADPCESVSSGK